jgi:hypothetical protein
MKSGSLAKHSGSPTCSDLNISRGDGLNYRLDSGCSVGDLFLAEALCVVDVNLCVGVRSLSSRDMPQAAPPAIGYLIGDWRGGVLDAVRAWNVSLPQSGYRPARIRYAKALRAGLSPGWRLCGTLGIEHSEKAFHRRVIVAVSRLSDPAKVQGPTHES